MSVLECLEGHFVRQQVRLKVCPQHTGGGQPGGRGGEERRVDSVEEKSVRKDGQTLFNSRDILIAVNLVAFLHILKNVFFIFSTGGQGR